MIDPIRSQAEQVVEALRMYGQHQQRCQKVRCRVCKLSLVGGPHTDEGGTNWHSFEWGDCTCGLDAALVDAEALAARDPRLPQPEGGDDPDALRMQQRIRLSDPRASVTTGDRLEPAGDPRLPQSTQLADAWYLGRRSVDRLPYSEANEPAVQGACEKDVATIIRRPPMKILDVLHNIMAVHGIASRAFEYERLVTDLVHWAADACRQSRSLADPPARFPEGQEKG